MPSAGHLPTLAIMESPMSYKRQEIYFILLRLWLGLAGIRVCIKEVVAGEQEERTVGDVVVDSVEHIALLADTFDIAAAHIPLIEVTQSSGLTVNKEKSDVMVTERQQTVTGRPN